MRYESVRSERAVRGATVPSTLWPGPRGVSRKPARRLAPLLVLLAASLFTVHAEDGTGGQGPRKIIGGTPAPAGAYPWMVAVLASFEPDPFFAQYCAGTLIAPRWVLSAAHCFVDNGVVTQPSDVSVMIGEVDLVAGPPIHAVDRIIVHEGYSEVGNSSPSDIALLRLAEPVDSPTLPINELADNPLVAPGAAARIIGWGTQMYTEEDGASDYPIDLQQADLPIVSNQECQAALPEVEIVDSNLCAGNLVRGGVDTCTGDSGGPLFVSNGSGGYLLAGITSFGIGCGLPNRPGVYTRVSSFVDWIEQNMFDTLIVPHWGNGQGLVTDLIVYNTSSTSASESVIGFRDGNGADVPMATILAQTSPSAVQQGVVLDGNRLELPPLGTHTLSTTGIGGVTSGSIRVSSMGDVGAAIRFRLPGIGITGVGTATPAASLIAPVRRDGPLSTGVAIHNPGGDPVTVDLTLRDPSGQTVANGQATVDLPAGGQTARFIDQLFPMADTASFRGTITVQARTGVVAAVALELGNQAGEFTTLPVSAFQ